MAALIADLTITIVAVFCDVFFSENEYFFAMLSLPLLVFKAVYSVCRAKRDKFINCYCFARKKRKIKSIFPYFNQGEYYEYKR